MVQAVYVGVTYSVISEGKIPHTLVHHAEFIYINVSASV